MKLDFLCVIDILSKYAGVVTLKDKKGTTIVNAFQNIVDSSKRKPSRIWIDQASKFYEKPFKKWLEDNGINMYSTHNEGKSVAAERFIRTLKNKFFKHMTVASKNVYFTFLEDIVNKYKNTYHKTNKMKPVDVKSTSYTEYNVDSNEKDPKFQVGDHVRMSKYENIFVKGYAPNWTKKVFVIKKVENTVP